jgi:hypothetical protein
MIILSYDTKEKFGDVEKPNVIGRNIIQLSNPTPAQPCGVGQIQIGEYCKNVATDEYTRICNVDEKYSDGYCVKICPTNTEPTGNANYCLSKCPEGYVGNGNTCLKYGYIKLT